MGSWYGVCVGSSCCTVGCWERHQFELAQSLFNSLRGIKKGGVKTLHNSAQVGMGETHQPRDPVSRPLFSGVTGVGPQDLGGIPCWSYILSSGIWEGRPEAPKNPCHE